MLAMLGDIYHVNFGQNYLTELCELAHYDDDAHDGTSVDEPVWQLRDAKEVASPSPLPDSANESEEPVSEAIWCAPPGIVATRYLASPTAAPDTHSHIFRETTYNVIEKQATCCPYYHKLHLAVLSPESQPMRLFALYAHPSVNTEALQLFRECQHRHFCAMRDVLVKLCNEELDSMIETS
ncbi:hypothetical protein GWK47_004686 [Chionoecetes opilio]|uniref:Uncharacterized protein n=1 Tax=Chionoecetes opilio TaxID=41210 RepID=A0A8J4YCD1_CHIOP|nr:hypothetical protein GWK47_004686 [Chionoecetes opilio]